MRHLLAALWIALGAALIGLAPGQSWVPAAQAQQAMNGPDYALWEDLAALVEDALESDEVATTELENLRRKVVEFRQKFVDAQDANATPLRTLREQIEALGPVPEDGVEPEEIAAQRAELNRRLARLEGPVRMAELARSRADGLIAGIDETIRERQTAELLRLGPMPVNPLHWPEAARSIFTLLAEIRTEVQDSWRSPLGRVIRNDNLPVIFAWTLLGLVLLTRGRNWSGRVMRRLDTGEPSAGRWIAIFGVSLGEWLLPYAGVYALVQAITVSDILGPKGQIVLAPLLLAAFLYLQARWLSQRVFPRIEPHGPMLRLDERARYLGRLYGALLGAVVAAFYIVQEVARDAGWSEAANNVVIFPLQVLTGLLLWRVAALLRQHQSACEEDTESETRFADMITRGVSRVIVAVALVGPLLAAVGYVKAAQALMLPTAMSLLMLAALLILQRLVTELYVMITGNREGARDSLVPVLAGFGLILVSVPGFALIWGARPAQLMDFWTRLSEGVSLGGIKLSPAVFLTFLIVFGLGFMATRLLQGALRNTILPKTRIDTGGRNAIVAGVGYVGIFLAALIAITSAGIDLSSLAIVAGALSVGIGFGLQNIVSNFVSGIILLIERPISEGDWIEVGGKHGYVRAISVRSTRIETFDRTDVIVPNADFVSGTVTNYTRGNTVGRAIVAVGVAYGTDTRKVEQILREVAEAHPMVLMNPKPTVLFQGFGDSSLDFEIRAILRDVNWVASVKSDMNHEIARRFAEEGIEIPFPQRDLWLRNPETLRGEAQPPAGTAAPGASTAVPAMLAEGDFDGPEGDGDGR
ncbi:MAG: mechanosensitive ion channel family protein [Roseovarius sp.]|nr:mechanosensitive ion channel family protein [Roseovarius sp.]